jgi:O-antigen/teichoic acid export membrane protein
MFAPWFFETMLQNRYADGLSVMPMAFVFSIWVSIATIGQNYLWVAERGKLVAVAIGVGLVANILLNLALLPIWGLHGAVTATLVANGVMLIGLWLAMARHGYVLDRTTYYVTILPATLLAGPWTAIACLIVTCTVCPQANLWIAEVWAMLVSKLRRQTAVA